MDRAKRLLTEERYHALKRQWASLDSSGSDHKTADGMIMTLLKMGLSKRVIIAVFGCGSSRVKRVRLDMMDPQRLDKPRPPPHHAVTDDDMRLIKDHIESYDTEDGFPCAHRKPRKYFVEQGLTWTKVHENYSKSLEQDNVRVISYSRFLQYVKH